MYYLNHGYMSKPSMKHIQLWFNSTQSGIERWSTSFWSLGGHLCYWMIRSKHFIGGLYSVFGKMRTFTIPFQWTRHIPLVREAFPFTKCVHRWALAGLAKYVRSKTAPFRKFRFPPRTISWTHFDGIRALSGSILVILAQNISGFKSMVGSKYIQFKTGRTRKILFR